MEKIKVDIIVPLYNEVEVFPKLIERLNNLIERAQEDISVILVDDGSKDNTAQMVADLCHTNKNYSGVVLSRNFGHQIALTAGINVSNSSDNVLIIDADLQDPPELLFDMLRKMEAGYDVVYGVRKNRKESRVRIFFFDMFYRVLKKIAYHDLPLDAGDFALLSRKVVDALKNMPEESRYLRGMRSWVGFNQVGLEYDRSEREEGLTKYSYSKRIKFAFDGVFNFSRFPIKVITFLGTLTVLTSLIYFGHTLYKKYYLDQVEDGFTATIFLIILFGGVQLISIGIIGEYLLRVFFQVKNRPLYLVKETYINNSDKESS